MRYKIELKTIVGIEFVSKSFAFKASPLTQINMRSNDKRSFHWVELPDPFHSGCNRPSIFFIYCIQKYILETFFFFYSTPSLFTSFSNFCLSNKINRNLFYRTLARFTFEIKKNSHNSWCLYLFRNCTIRKSFFINPRCPPSVLSSLILNAIR